MRYREKGSTQSKYGIKISIVIPTLNQAETLEHTLLSIINQNYQNIEIIVMDGGSTDFTLDVINKYKGWITLVSSKKDNGQSDAINQGFRFASGDIFAWINSDDYYLPNAFSQVASFFESNPNLDIIVGGGEVITRDGVFLKHIKPMLMNHDNLIKWIDGEWIMQQSCFWRKKIWDQSGGVDEGLNLLMDVDLWFRFARIGTSFTISDNLAVMRYYPEVKTVALKEYVKEEIAYVLAKNSKLKEVRQLVRAMALEIKNLQNEIDNKNKNILIRCLKRFGVAI